MSLDNAIEPERMPHLPDDSLSYREDGKDNIYQGILWMKEKYEQYREQADRRYELLKEELNRSERRYQDLLLSMEESKSGLPPAAALAMVEAQYIQACQQLDARQSIIDGLEEKLRIERLRE